MSRLHSWTLAFYCRSTTCSYTYTRESLQVKQSTRNKLKNYSEKTDGKSSKMLLKIKRTLMQKLLRSLTILMSLIASKKHLVTKFSAKTLLMSIEKEWESCMEVNSNNSSCIWKDYISTLQKASNGLSIGTHFHFIFQQFLLITCDFSHWKVSNKYAEKRKNPRILRWSKIQFYLNTDLRRWQELKTPKNCRNSRLSTWVN